MVCPDDSTLTALAARTLSTLEAARIEAHFADCDDCRRLAFALSSVPEGEATAEAAGERIGRFEVVEVIGSGAMGIVYRARDPELDRFVAIKVRHTAAKLDAIGEDRLRREAQALARLAHPNVVAVHETGRHEGRAYVAMELVEGATLDVWLATEPPRADVLGALIGAGRGLEAAHAAGLIHRDFKPRNVFVAAADRVKVGDFGLVRVDRLALRGAAVPDRELTTTLSLTGSIVGTPAYMAPEQLRGEPATEASDQYSYCVTVYEALAGERPEPGQPLDLPAGTRVRVRRALERGLDPDPTKRFPSMTALLDTLAPRPLRARWLAAAALGGAALLAAGSLAASDTPVDPCARPDAEAQRVFADRTFAFASAFASTGARNAGITAAHTAKLFGDYGERWYAASTASCRATAQHVQSAELGDRQRACLARRLREADGLAGVLVTLPDAETVGKASSAVLGLANVEACTRAEVGATDPVPFGREAKVREVERELDRITGLYKTGQFRAAAADIDAVVMRARTLAYPSLLASALLAQSSIHSATNRFDKLESIYDEAAREAAKARDDRRAAEALLRRTYAVGVHMTRHEEALKWARAADAAVLRAGDPPDLRAALHMNLGVLYTELGKLDDAERAVRAALELREKYLPTEMLLISDAHNNLGAILQGQGKADGAQHHFEKSIALERAMLGEEHPALAESYLNLGYLQVERNAPKDGLANLAKAQDIAERALGPDHSTVGIVLDVTGMAYVGLGDYPKAADYHRRAYDIMLAKLGPKHPRTGYAIANLARTAMRLGDYPTALSSYQRAQELLSEAVGPKHDLVARIRAGIATVLQFTGDIDGAAREYQAALAIFEANHGREFDEAAMMQTNLGQLAMQRGRTGEARAHFERSFATLHKLSGPNDPYTLTPHAGLVMCDVVQGRFDRERFAALERAAIAGKVETLEPHARGFIEFARAKGHAALGDTARAKQLVETSRAAYVEAAMDSTAKIVENWAAKELR